MLDWGGWGLVDGVKKSAMLDGDVMSDAQIRGAVNQSDVTGSGETGSEIQIFF